MNPQYKKVKKYYEMMSSKSRYCNTVAISEIAICPCDYKEGHTPPALSEFVPYVAGSDWGTGDDSHAWFHFTVEVPEELKAKPVLLSVKTDKGGWDAVNPQFILYINGRLVQGLDTNHTTSFLEGEDTYDVYVYGYTGAKIPKAKFFAEIMNLNVEVEQLMYDIKVPFEMLDYLRPDSQEYMEILYHLHKAVSLFDLYELNSEDYFASISKAKKYMDEEFYGKFCKEQPATVICIGHTHIDCAWRWTLKQTREKVQRSFSTVLELMKRYPEYKFMSSQALLYKNMKEEAPELYEEIKERVKEGRWEVEGSMWVEADCNLSSGESLIRQVVYGKRFFKDEFGVDNHVLWLPDVFGYAAAMPQILRKSGVDWFVTSKINWNDTNTMPYDTFSWAGIDGTEINTYFITAQDRAKALEEGGFRRGATYNGNTGSRMIEGTWERYMQKQLNNEVLLPYGYGDGGGGPTAEYLEMRRRTERGIPGAPNAKVGFVGEFLDRLGKKIENNPLLPKWRGELYLEFHRGTYTSIAKNKRNNRQSEFLFLDAEFMASMAKSILGGEFPKDVLRHGWEMILTNQFHDIIPGSSIKEVYDQSDIDYAEIKGIGNKIVDGAKASFAEKVSADKGYIVFNPHSFIGNGTVKVNGKTVYVKDVPSKGYACVNEFKDDNNILIDGRTVDTDVLTVKFDENWLIESVYDKKNDREVITPGQKGNEIRVYADYPDVYDAWEWQQHSLESYKVMSDVSDVEVIDDGVRRGIKIVRPFMRSTFTQTVWFYEGTSKIDFETVVDWHQQHQMVKAAFPVEVNSDKATYEIQFGKIERPTHKNTSWEDAKFEVCGHKYADLSDGGYGVSLMNDCKYGYDIHGNLMQLSLFKCATAPNPEADQGEIVFTYSLYPHAGSLNASDTVKEAYYLNYPMTAVKAEGKETLVPESFSMITLDRENVICETVKEAEQGSDLVFRLYESKNMRGKVNIKLGFKAEKAYLCDMLENEIEELPLNDGVITTEIKGFEILTIKVK